MMETYQKNTGIVVFNKDKKVLMFRRVDGENSDIWQFPQGKIEKGEAFLEGGLRELEEETGITSVKVVSFIDKPLQYDFPPDVIDSFKKMGRTDIGKHQYWVLVYFYGNEDEIAPLKVEHVELGDFEWVTFDQPVKRAWKPKKEVYEKIMQKFSPLIENFE